MDTRRRSSADPKSPGRAAWDGDPPHVAAARQRLLEATARCIAREGIAATTVAAVAAEAGVSRQTVYRYFTGRDQLVLRCIRATADGIRAKIDRTVDALADPADMVVESVVLGLVEVRSDPVLRAIWDSSELDSAVFSRIADPSGIAWLREPMAPAIEAAGWNAADADAGLELILRIFLSLIVSPSPERSPDEIRAFLYRHLVPGLGLAVTKEM